MRTLRVITLAATLTLAAAAGCDGPAPRPPGDKIEGMATIAPVPSGPSWAPKPRTLDGLATAAVADAHGFALFTEHGDVHFLPGVNLGSTTPGHQPGELAITATDYRRWFDAMGRMGIRVVRVYTIHPPAFYRELADYNTAHPTAPLYLMQGVYLPDESYLQSQNLYDTKFTGAFRQELLDAVGAVHGSLTRAPQRGRASGTWSADVSGWLAAWIIGAELDPFATLASDQRNARAPGHSGRYFRSTADASPTERWLAARMDEVAMAEAERWQSVPIAFVNWPTTDPLRHPSEPLPQEDMVGIDANHVRPTPAWPGGTFASYHAYPYYPDFQRHEPGLQKVKYHGRADPYAGYLTALQHHHTGMPVMITEFGEPSSIGSAHYGPLGRDQGGHSEREAMAADAELLRLIRDLGLAGGLVFEWTDEWFKFTWNTINHQIPADRRQLWHDPLTNEQYFGIIATDPTGAVRPDPTVLTPPHAGTGQARKVTARIDESFVYLDVRLAQPPREPVTIGLDVVPGPPGHPPAGSNDGLADMALVLDTAARDGQVWLRDRLDAVPLDYPAAGKPAATDGWSPMRLVVNRALAIPSTGQKLPTEILDISHIRYGDWDPGHSDVDSRALWRLSGSTLFLRIPWAVAGFADPSSHRALVPDAPDHTIVAPGIGLSVATAGQTVKAGTLKWDNWQRVGTQERLKAGADVLRAAMLDVSG
jgi:hypothetical protein